MKTLIAMMFMMVSLPTLADSIRVAVANNFFGPLKALALDYTDYSGHELVISTGSTGQLFAQISHGAPFDLFLSADTERPAKLVELGLAQDAFTYAQGRLVLWSSDTLLFDDNETALDNVQIKHLGIPNPKLAPYGVAALQVMQNTQRYSALKSKLVEGKNLSAVYQYVTTGNAQAGFLSMSQIYKSGHYIEGSYWIIPNELYQPIKQDAVVLTPALNSKVVENFIVYLQGERARSIMSEFGYL